MQGLCLNQCAQIDARLIFVYVASDIALLPVFLFYSLLVVSMKPEVPNQAAVYVIIAHFCLVSQFFFSPLSFLNVCISHTSHWQFRFTMQHFSFYFSYACISNLHSRCMLKGYFSQKRKFIYMQPSSCSKQLMGPMYYGS